MFNILKLFKLPSPVELGKATHNALPFRDLPFNTPKDKYTWEDWLEEVKRDYPVRYFFNRVLPHFIRSLSDPFVYVYNFLKYNLVPKHRYHILDLRQPKTQCDNYRWGYTDIVERILFANFNLLNQFVELELDEPIETKIANLQKLIEETKDDDEREVLTKELELYKEVSCLYDWWNYLRKAEYEEKEILSNIDKKKWIEADQKFDEKEQKMFMRLSEIRRFLWT